jgi:hypothetical protein
MSGCRWIVRVKTQFPSLTQADIVREVRTESAAPNEAMIQALTRMGEEDAFRLSDGDRWTVTIERVR